MTDKLWRTIILLSVGFTGAVFATGGIELINYLFTSRPLILAAIIPMLPFIACIMGVLVYGAYQIILATYVIAYSVYRFLRPKFWGVPSLPGHQESGPFR